MRPVNAQRTCGLGRDQRGVAYLEFLIILMPFLLLFFGSVQLALIGAAKLVVQHSASTAARAAAVVLDDDPARYDGEARNLIEEHTTGGDGLGGRIASKIEEWIADLRGGSETFTLHLANRGNNRLSAIRHAAYVPLSALAPQPDRVIAWFQHPLGPVAERLESALGGNPAARLLMGLLAYNRVGAAITFPTGPGLDDLHPDPTTIGWDEKQLTVRVTYLFHCGVPLASSFMCKTMWQLSGLPDAARGTVDRIGGASFEDAADPEAFVGDITSIIGQATRIFAELTHAEVPSLQYPLFATNAHFYVLRAEASVPNQGAAYKYASELGETPSGQGAPGFGDPPAGAPAAGGGSGGTPPAAGGPSSPATPPGASPPGGTPGPGGTCSILTMAAVAPGAEPPPSCSQGPQIPVEEEEPPEYGPAGGIASHEGPGRGHTLARHVGKTPEELAQRLTDQPNIPAASTFAHVGEADAAVSSVLALPANQDKIQDWVDNGMVGNLALVGDFSGGTVLVRGATDTVPGQHARVVLKKDPNGGWFILTAYPEP